MSFYSSINKFQQWFNKFKLSPFVKMGLPLIILCVGGSFALTNVQRIKVEHQRQKSFQESLQLQGENLRKPVDWQLELAKIQQVDTSNWQNVRGPRAWEDNEEWNRKKEEQEKRFEEQLKQMSESKV